MKKLKFFILAIIPSLILACNEGGNNSNKSRDDNNQNRNNNEMQRGARDTVSQGSLMIRFSKAKQGNDQKFVK